jgi:hypothetical protein
MTLQAGLTGFFLYQESLSAQQASRTPEPLPVFILSTLGVLALAALVNGVAEYKRTRRRQSLGRTAVVAEVISSAARTGRKRADDKVSNDNQDRSRPTG